MDESNDSYFDLVAFCTHILSLNYTLFIAGDFRWCKICGNDRRLSDKCAQFLFSLNASHSKHTPYQVRNKITSMKQSTKLQQQ